MRKRLRKKLHRRELHHRVVDLSQRSYWRRRLFDAHEHEAYLIDCGHLEGLPSDLVGAIRAHNLRFEAAKVSPAEAPSWLSEGGLIIFRFRAAEFPSVVAYTGNNPKVV